MKQFSKPQWDRIQQRVQQQPEIVTALIAANRVILNSETCVPKTGIATWNLYYFCPDHGVRLLWDRHSPAAHRCPIDNKVFTGEPYDGAWWRGLNGLNAKACNQLGLLWQLTGETRYLDKVRDILMSYARYYPGYEIHGGIPYNGPGKANAQTLCEANCHLDFTLGYDFIAEALTQEQRDYIVTRLLRAGADFLVQHRARQLHNHEVKISSTIGVIGMILGDDAYLEFAVNAEYGLRHQLEHGLLAEGLWFEGSIHYHFYALQGFWSFEKLARGSQYSLLDLPQYRRMLSFPLQLLMPDATFPRINDCIAGQEKLNHSHIYEFAYQIYGGDDYAAALQYCYRQSPRRNLDALLYGVDDLPQTPVALIPEGNVHAPGCGLSVLRNPAHQRALLVKHSPYGGEHDHYDRLNIILFNNGKEILPDLGTTGYGAELHYGYYKNSPTHNTLSINQTNQPPAVPEVLNWHQEAAFAWLDTQVDWSKPAPVLDSHTRIQWDSESYKNVIFRRRILWLDDAIIDVSNIHNPHQQQLDWTLHVDGEALDPQGEPTTFTDSGPLRHLHEIVATPLQGTQLRQFNTVAGTLSVWLNANATIFQGVAPANPSVRDLSYLILRSENTEAQFACVYDLNDVAPLLSVTIEKKDDRTTVVLSRATGDQQFDLSVDPSVLPAVS